MQNTEKTKAKRLQTSLQIVLRLCFIIVTAANSVTSKKGKTHSDNAEAHLCQHAFPFQIMEAAKSVPKAEQLNQGM